MAFVSLNYVDDVYTHQFSTIQAAIDWAYAEYGAVTDFANPVVIKIEPGIYTEQIHSYAGYYLVGEISGWYSVRGRPPPTLYNTGADAAHWPLRSHDGDIYQMIGMNIQTPWAADGVIGKLAPGDFMNCFFKNVHFIDRTEAGSGYMSFRGCTSNGSTYGGFNLTGTNLDSTGWLALTNCHLSGTPTFSSTHTTDSTVAFTNTFVNGHLVVSGDWNFYTALGGCNSWGEAARHSFDTTGKVKIYGGSCVNGIHFTSAPSTLEISGLTFSSLEDNQIPVGEADITADVDVTADVYIVNIPHNGISGKIKTPSKKKYVGSYTADAYLSIQDAIDSIPVSGEGVIELTEDLTNLSELTMTGAKSVTIDGGRAWSLSFATDIIELGLNQKLILSKMENISGGVIEINGNSAKFHLHSCNHDFNFSILLTSGVGASVYISASNYVAPTGLSALQVNSADPDITIESSKLLGATGQPAVEFTVEADDKLKAKFSTFIHGDGGGNSPLSSTAADSNIAMYACGLNASWTPTHFTNTIGSAGNITDPQIDF